MVDCENAEILRWGEGGSSLLLEQLEDKGIARLEPPPGGFDTSCAHAIFRQVFGQRQTYLKSTILEVMPKESHSSIVGSNLYGPPHTDDEESLPPHLQILYCDKAAKNGGENIYIDTWKLLLEIKKVDPCLYHDLFSKARMFAFNNKNIVRPTFSLRYGNLICSSPPQSNDDVGARFGKWLENAPRYEFKIGQGEACIINHHRVLHGRREFTGSRRFLRFQFWLKQPFRAPAEFINRARIYQEMVRDVPYHGPSWIRELFSPADSSSIGLERLAPVVAHLCGLSRPEVCARFGISGVQLERWSTLLFTVMPAVYSSEEADPKISDDSISKFHQAMIAADGAD